MALVTLVGYPCSGKTRFARLLEQDLRRRLADVNYAGPKLDVVVVDDEGSHVSRTVYDESSKEKSGRANLFSSVVRSLGTENIVICDSLNYIKGFRYQMYCAAREAQVRVCTIHLASPPEKCRGWHEQRGESSYKPATFDNLLMRFEEPSSMVRWDSPLVTIPWDEEPPFDAIWEIVTKGEKKGPTAAVAQRPKPAPNTLQTLTNTTSTINTSLLEMMNSGPATSTFTIPSPPAPTAGQLILHLPMRRVTLPEMQRLKRQFEGVQTRAQQSGGRAATSWNEAEVANSYVRFLETTWETNP